MNKLSKEKRAAILSGLIEGCGVRATARIAGVDKKTVLRLLADVGALCADIHDLYVTDLKIDRLEVDECWAFVGCKEKSKKQGKAGYGDIWVWVAIDPVSKLVAAWHAGNRDSEAAHSFMWDICDRTEGQRLQITTDAHGSYPGAIRAVFGDAIDYAVLQKVFAAPQEPEKRYSPAKCCGSFKSVVCGNPDEKRIGTSIVERQNLSLRMTNRRYTRLTSSYSRKVSFHVHSLALHYIAHNFIRRHKAIGTTPAKHLGLVTEEWTVATLAAMLESEENKRGRGGRINRTDKK